MFTSIQTIQEIPWHTKVKTVFALLNFREWQNNTEREREWERERERDRALIVFQVTLVTKY